MDKANLAREQNSAESTARKVSANFANIYIRQNVETQQNRMAYCKLPSQGRGMSN